ncbi:oxidoreductase [Kamptonema cortianum]|nr:oxidoreductase [Geitlerinema splendidum]MDK3162210.1 oxidoreductase [Kamptonema cortianum]
MSFNRTWFITGCSSGFGRLLVEHVAAAGHKVVATARKVESIQDLDDRFENVIACKLDVTAPEEIQAAVNAATQKFGKIDVLVNNAGFGLMGTVEEISDAEAKYQFETNVFGVLNVLRAVLPSMRANKSGHILNISSIAGLTSNRGFGMYCATKHALEALSESLSQEVEPFGINVTIVEPGGFRTDFAGRSIKEAATVLPDYAEMRENLRKAVAEFDGNQPGDPVKAVIAMMRITNEENPPLRLLLGEDAWDRAQAKIESLRENFFAWEKITRSMGVEHPGLN